MRRSADSEERTAFLEDGVLLDADAQLKLTGSSALRRSQAVRVASWFRSRPRSLRRLSRRHPLFLLARYAVLVVLALLVATPLFASSYTRPPPHYRDLESRCARRSSAVPSVDSGCANAFNEQVFISVSLYDKNGHLANGAWGQRLLELINLIGEDNVFLSIYENDSGAEGARALESLKKKLRCRHMIVNDAHVPLADFPTLKMPDGSDRTKRLAYLSEMRNRALRPIDTFDEELGIVEYDKILFLNDVSFHPTDAAQLLFNTNVGADGKARYLSACGLDFLNPAVFYDLYAQRDAEGFSGGLPIFPFFSNEGQAISRAAIMGQTDAVPVSSCWGGIVAMQARYVQNLNRTLPEPHFQDIGSHVVDPVAPKNVTSPVRFRYEPEIFFDACECCLFLADVAQAARREGGKEMGTYVNPYVRVAYTDGVLAWIPWVKRWERLFIVPQWIITHLVRLPTHNPHRTAREGDSFMEEIWKGDRWEMVQRPVRNGLFCGVREMQLLQQNERSDDVNWENTKMPAGQTLDFPT
ncbi:cryptococcal mannosyltransferase 1-domain-containing protein [Xylariales sp. AK1849]|nr:cryptococcal mannosyltransferase 1-domain-containing protein [Xylariales sp. AK1849]